MASISRTPNIPQFNIYMQEDDEEIASIEKQYQLASKKAVTVEEEDRLEREKEKFREEFDRSEPFDPPLLVDPKGHAKAALYSASLVSNAFRLSSPEHLSQQQCFAKLRAEQDLKGLLSQYYKWMSYPITDPYRSTISPREAQEYQWLKFATIPKTVGLIFQLLMERDRKGLVEFVKRAPNEICFAHVQGEDYEQITSVFAYAFRSFHKVPHDEIPLYLESCDVLMHKMETILVDSACKDFFRSFFFEPCHLQSASVMEIYEHDRTVPKRNEGLIALLDKVSDSKERGLPKLHKRLKDNLLSDLNAFSMLVRERDYDLTRKIIKALNLEASKYDFIVLWDFVLGQLAPNMHEGGRTDHSFRDMHMSENAKKLISSVRAQKEIQLRVWRTSERGIQRFLSDLPRQNYFLKKNRVSEEERKLILSGKKAELVGRDASGIPYVVMAASLGQRFTRDYYADPCLTAQMCLAKEKLPNLDELFFEPGSVNFKEGYSLHELFFTYPAIPEELQEEFIQQFRGLMEKADQLLHYFSRRTNSFRWDLNDDEGFSLLYVVFQHILELIKFEKSAFQNNHFAHKLCTMILNVLFDYIDYTDLLTCAKNITANLNNNHSNDQYFSYVLGLVSFSPDCAKKRDALCLLISNEVYLGQLRNSYADLFSLLEETQEPILSDDLSSLALLSTILELNALQGNQIQKGSDWHNSVEELQFVISEVCGAFRSLTIKDSTRREEVFSQMEGFEGEKDFQVLFVSHVDAMTKSGKEAREVFFRASKMPCKNPMYSFEVSYIERDVDTNFRKCMVFEDINMESLKNIVNWILSESETPRTIDHLLRYLGDITQEVHMKSDQVAAEVRSDAKALARGYVLDRFTELEFLGYKEYLRFRLLTDFGLMH